MNRPRTAEERLAFMATLAAETDGTAAVEQAKRLRAIMEGKDFWYCQALAWEEYAKSLEEQLAEAAAFHGLTASTRQQELPDSDEAVGPGRRAASEPAAAAAPPPPPPPPPPTPPHASRVTGKRKRSRGKYLYAHEMFAQLDLSVLDEIRTISDLRSHSVAGQKFTHFIGVMDPKDPNPNLSSFRFRSGDGLVRFLQGLYEEQYPNGCEREMNKTFLRKLLRRSTAISDDVGERDGGKHGRWHVRMDSVKELQDRVCASTDRRLH